MADVPTFDAMMNPTIHALKNLGGSGTINERDINHPYDVMGHLALPAVNCHFYNRD